MTDRLTDAELAALPEATRTRLLLARELRETCDADLLGAALYGRLCDEGYPEVAEAVRLALASRRGAPS